MSSIAAQRPNPRTALALLPPALIAGAVLLTLAFAALIGRPAPSATDAVAAVRSEPPSAAPPRPATAPATLAEPAAAASSPASSVPDRPRRGAHPRPTTPRRVHVTAQPRAAQAGRRDEPAQDPLLDDAAAAGMTSRAKPPERPQ